jgi:VCBS repeat-containing protein
VQAETLEDRVLLAMVFTSNDSYTTYKDSFNSANEGAASVLANDFDTDSNPLTASLVSGPSHGTLSLNANGSFVYTPTAGYYGSDSFVYSAVDALGSASANGTATITVASAFSAQVNAPDQPFSGVIAQNPFSTSQLTGAAQTSYALGHGHDLAYNSLTADVMPIISVESAVGSSGGGTSVPVPDSIEMHTTFGGLTASTLYFNDSGISAGNNVYFADQLDASSLATGHYQYQVTLIAHYGTTTSTRVFTGY